MKRSFALEIPNPCTANWQEMPSTGEGMFCLDCQKRVVDFSALTEQELKRYFKGYEGTVCGRFQPHQLKAYAHGHALITPFYKLLALVGLSFIMPAALAHQPLAPAVTQTEPAVADACVTLSASSDSTNMYRVTGSVFYTENDTTLFLPGASIRINDTRFGTLSDAAGNFEIAFKNPSSKPLSLTVSFIGFIPLETELNFTSSNTLHLGALQFQMEPSLMGEVVIVERNPLKNLWWRIKNLFI